MRLPEVFARSKHADVETILERSKTRGKKQPKRRAIARSSICASDYCYRWASLFILNTTHMPFPGIFTD
jgi:hypothetical protein